MYNGKWKFIIREKETRSTRPDESGLAQGDPRGQEAGL